MRTKNFSLCLILSFCALRASAQIGVPNTSPVSENFDGMGATLNLPTNWRVAAGTGPTYSGGTAAVTQQASTGSPVQGGMYNWGVTNTSDRAVGSMTSGSFPNPRSVMGYYRNTNTTNLTALSVAYTAERYRQNSAAASIQFFYSLNGNAWTAVAAGDISTSSFPTGLSTHYFSSPTPTISMSGINITGLNIAPNGDFYLRWNINTTGTNSQGIGIDDISVTATFVTPMPEINLQTPVGTNVVCGTGTAAFGSVNVGSSATRTIRIQNLGTAALNLTGLPLSITGTNADQFSIITQPTSPIAAGSFSDMVVQFTPTSSGAKTASISIANNDSNENPCAINLTGTGVQLTPDINLQTPVGTNVACGTGTAAFGSINVGSSTTRTVRIQNVGTGALNLSNLPLTITGTNADQFSIITQPTSPIAAGASVDMVVQFSPTASGALTATLSFASDDPDENPCDLQLTGTGVALISDINLQSPVGTNIACGSGVATFGSIDVGSSTTRTIRIQNLGTAPLNLPNLPLITSGVNADQFVVLTQPASPIAVGSFSEMVVQFAPTVAGTLTANISIDSDDPDENPCSITLSGTGLALLPDINLQAPLGTNVACGTGTAAFGNVNIGNSSTQSIRIQNVGTAPLNLSNLPFAITGTNADQFTIVIQPSSPIAVGAFTDIVVQFTPTNAGLNTASISIESDDPDENPCMVLFSGTGVTPAPDINLQTPIGTNVACGAGTVNFATVGIGSSGTATVRIFNLGAGPLNLSNLPLSITGTHASQFNIITQPASSIAAGSFSDMVIQFTPTSPGVKTANISIGSNDPDENPCTIALSGTGLLQALFFRSQTSGNWTDASTWETSTNNSIWSNAVLAPVNYATDLTVTIRSGHIVALLDDITVDQLVIAAGGTLSINDITLLTINNGSGVDFDVQGTFEDGASAANTAVFASNASWQLGGNGTFLKTNDSGMANFRTNYQGGISGIPESAFWIIRLSSDLSLENVGMYYPNLSLESLSGVVNYNMTGSTASCTVKGNLDVGTNGGGTVNLNNENTYSSTFQVIKNLTIGNRSKITNSSGTGTTYGNGFDLYGNLTMGGDVELNFGSGTSKGVLSFKGVNPQNVTGDGTMFVNNLVVNKSDADVNFMSIPSSPVVFEQINLISKNIVLNEVDLWLEKNCQVVNASNSSYVQTNALGTVRRETTSTHPFPIGLSSYNPITITGTGALDYFHARVKDEVLEDGTMGAPFTTNVVDRTWFVTEEATGGNTMSLTMTWYSSDELGGFARNACYVSHYNGTLWSGPPPSGAGGTGTGPFTRTRTGQTSFSPFSVGSNGALPIELLRFTATLHNKQVSLDWQTASEQDNARFVLEHSIDGIQFSKIGTVAGAGNSQAVLSYQFWDTKPVPGTNYYRLKQVDYDGQFTYSPVVTVNFDGPGGFRLFPVPVKDHLQLQLDAPDAFESQWFVYNALGQLVLSGQMSADQSTLDVDVSDLAPGMYLLQRTSDRARNSRMFVKE